MGRNESPWLTRASLISLLPLKQHAVLMAELQAWPPARWPGGPVPACTPCLPGRRPFLHGLPVTSLPRGSSLCSQGLGACLS